MNGAARDAIAIRSEGATDATHVRAILAAAFASRAEADLVDWLRAEDEFVLRLVAEDAGGRAVGFIGFPRLFVEHAGTDAPAVGLAPLAVVPAMQRQGIGTALVKDGLARLANRTERLVFVVGDPRYYRRFGFDSEAAAPFDSPYSGGHFMVRRLAEDPPAAGRLRYPRAFADLG